MSKTSWCRYICFFDLLKQYIGYIFEKLYLHICNNLNTYMPTVSRSMLQFNWLMMLIMIPIANAVWGKYTTRKHARNHSKYHADCTDNAFCNIGLSNFISKCGLDVSRPSFLWLIAITTTFFNVSW